MTFKTGFIYLYDNIKTDAEGRKHSITAELAQHHVSKPLKLSMKW